jgi:hypothetical protein
MVFGRGQELDGVMSSSISPSYSTQNRMTSSVPFADQTDGSHAWGLTERKCW